MTAGVDRSAATRVCEDALAEYEMCTTLLWRESGWHCTCGRVESQWVAQLYLNDVIVEETTADLLSSMLRIAHQWHAAVKGNPSALILVDDSQFENERRQNVLGPRAVPRGGRRTASVACRQPDESE
jgi:hypothetical protein